MVWRDVFVCVYFGVLAALIAVIGIWFLKYWRLRQLLRKFGSVKISNARMTLIWPSVSASSLILKYVVSRAYEYESNDSIKQAGRRARPVLILGIALVMINFVFIALLIFAETRY